MAQEEPRPPSEPLTLSGAIEFAQKNYPAIRAAMAEVSSADGEIERARTAYLPRTGLHLQINRATLNNIFGLTFQNPVLPPISGPPVADATGQSAFGTAAGILFAWEPFDFGLRKANVAVAESLKSEAAAGRDLTGYGIALGAAEAYFAAVGGREALAASEASVRRMEVFAESVTALVNAELRPGADLSRARAELAQARTDLIRAAQLAESAEASLAEALGVAGGNLDLRPAALLGEPPVDAADRGPAPAHPLFRVQQAKVVTAEARNDALTKEWRPKFEVQSAAFARGTGGRFDGTIAGGADGLYPNFGNWAAGFSMQFNLFDYKEIRARRHVEHYKAETERARQDEVSQKLRGDVARAEIAVKAARRIAENAAVQLQEARTLLGQAEARYRAELGTVVEVADAERLLRQAEVEDALARLGVWRSLFALAAARGNIEEIAALGSR